MIFKQEILFVATLSFLTPLFSSGQNTQEPVHKTIPAQLEKVGDPYLPNTYNNKKTSPTRQSNNALNQNTSIFTRQVNVDANGQNILGDAANEPNIAVNPENENEIVIGWRQFDNVFSNFRQAGWSYTTDGGAMWTFPGKIEAGIFRSDPVLDYDSAGNFYYNSLTIDNYNNYVCKVFKSIDGGATWDLGTDAHGGDKQWMTIDRTRGAGSGNIYAFWTYAYSSCLPGFFTRSTDEDQSYDSCSPVDGDPFWGTLAVGNNGELYIGGTDSLGNIIVTKSTNAQASDSAVTWSAPVQVNMDGFMGFSANVNPGGLMGQISIDVDRSNGTGKGNIYVLASLTRISITDTGDVMFARSTDGGGTWSAPVRVNDDSSTDNTQWFGTMSVAPNGRIDAIWLDTRDASPGLGISALYYSYSTDQGETWSKNERLSDPFDPHIGYPDQPKMGDYFDMISDSIGAHLAWANTLNGEEDVYYSRIIPQSISSVNKTPELNFSVSPNPTNGMFSLVSGLRNPGKTVRIEIYNEMGKMIYSQYLNRATSEIDISSEPAGIYFLKVIDDDGNSAVKKIVRE